MLILAALFFMGLAVYLWVAPNDWQEGEWMHYDSQTRKSTLHPKISGSMVMFTGIVCLGIGISTFIQDTNKARAEQEAQAVDDELSQAFNPILPGLEARAEAQPGTIMTLTPGERESAGISEEVSVYYGWCSTGSGFDRFYIVVQNWQGSDYQRGFPAVVWSTCGGSPADSEMLFDNTSVRWFELREDSIDYGRVLEATEFAPTEAVPHPTATP